MEGHNLACIQNDWLSVLETLPELKVDSLAVSSVLLAVKTLFSLSSDGAPCSLSLPFALGDSVVLVNWLLPSGPCQGLSNVFRLDASGQIRGQMQASI